MKLNTKPIPKKHKRPILAYYESADTFVAKLGRDEIYIQSIYYPNKTIESGVSVMSRSIGGVLFYKDFILRRTCAAKLYVPGYYILVHWEYL